MVRIRLAKDGILVAGDASIKHFLASIPGRSWDRQAKAWRVPLTRESVAYLRSHLPHTDLPDGIEAAIVAREERLRRAEEARQGNVGARLHYSMGKPFDHQRVAHGVGAALLSGTDNGAFALLHEQGLGKTMTSIALTGTLAHEDGLQRVLVVCPTSVIGVWVAEFNKWAAYPHTVAAMRGTAAQRLKALRALKDAPPVSTIHGGDGVRVLVCNYEILGRNAEILGAVEDFAPELIICDEAHRIKTISTRQSKALKRLASVGKWRIAATGTPVANLAIDVYGIYYWLDESIFGSSRTAFVARYAHTADLPGGGMMVTAMKKDMLADLSRRVHSIAHRATKADSLDLPDMMDVVVPVELEPKARKFYTQLRHESITQLDSGDVVVAAHVLTKALRLQQLVGGWAKAEGDRVQRVSEAKMRALKEFLADLDGKVVIFCRFTMEAREVRDVAHAMGLDPVFIDGSVSSGQRSDLIEKFQTDDACRVFVGQIQATSTGITLHAANQCVFYSTGYSLSEYEQAKARVHRIGQESKVTYTHLVATDTVDERIVSSLREKKTIADIVADNTWRDVL